MVAEISHTLLLGAVLFCIGIAICITKRNAIMFLMGVELILNAANINLIAFSSLDPDHIRGQFFSLFVIVIAAAEAAVALAIIIRVYRYFHTVRTDKVDEMKG